MFCSQTGQSAPIHPASLASVSTGTPFLNLNKAHHEFSGGTLYAEEDGGTRMGLIASVSPACKNDLLVAQQREGEQLMIEL